MSQLEKDNPELSLFLPVLDEEENLRPMHAKIADKFTVLRSMNQKAGGHPAGTMQMFSGDSDERDKPKPKYPDWMSVAHYLRSKGAKRTNPLPNYIGVNPKVDCELPQPSQ